MFRVSLLALRFLQFGYLSILNLFSFKKVVLLLLNKVVTNLGKVRLKNKKKSSNSRYPVLVYVGQD